MTSTAQRRRTHDRRSQPTPFLSRYWLTGRRRGGRRSDEQEGIYVDRYTFAEWLPVLGMVIFSALDLVLTLLYLQEGGEEANPVMDWAIRAGTPVFIALKLGLTSVGALFLLAHVRHRRVRVVLWVLVGLYLALLGYHIWLRAHLP